MKYRIWIVLSGILLIIGTCTVISAKNYIKNLPSVTLTSSVSNSIRAEKEVTGKVYYQETAEIELPPDCRIEEVFAYEGDNVTAGNPLVKIMEADLQIIYIQKQMEVESLIEIEENGGLEEELAYWKRQVIEQEIASLKNLIENEGIVYAESDGYVIQQHYKKGDVTVVESLLKLGVAEGGCYLEWRVEPSEYREYTSGYALLQDKKEEIFWEAPVYRDDTYVFTVQLPNMTECIHGKMTEVQLLYVSEEYEAMLPKNCIRYDTDGSPFVYQLMTRNRNFGKESYVRKVGVTIDDQDGINVVVKAALSDVVSWSSRELVDGEAVAVIEE